MGLLWKKGDSKYHKLISAYIGIPSLPAFIHIVFIRSFLPNETTLTVSMYLALVFTLLFVLIIYFFTKINRWKPTKAWYNFTLKKKIGLFIFGVSLQFSSIWVTTGYAIPFVYTSLIHTSSSEIIVSQKHTRSGNIGDCGYTLSNNKMEKWLFQICISKNFYNQLPDVVNEVIIYKKTSSLGFIVSKVAIYEER
jgi:hypothetical protein